MKHQMNILMAVLVLISLIAYQPIHAQQTLACEGVYEDVITSPIDLFIYGADLFIPDTDVLSIDIRGGDGGDVIFAETSCDTHIHGGTGARVQVSFEVGDDDDKLKPGGIIRTYRGERGGSRVAGCLNTGDEVSGGGGGATAIVYLPPEADATGANWRLLAVAGGGGGAVRPGPNKLDKVGGGGMAGVNGGNSGSSLGGSVNDCPEQEYCFIMDNRPGVGGSFGCGQGNSYHGDKVVVTHTPTNQDIIFVKLKPVNEYILTAGLPEGNLQQRGGFGFSGGGASGKGGGGGGGLYGGAVYCEEGGGGGGSWASSGFGAFDATITPGVAGGTTEFPTNGKMKITTYKLAEAVCPPITVALDENGDGNFNVPDYLLNSSIPCGGTAILSVFNNNSAEVYNSAVASEDLILLDCNDVGQTYTIDVVVFEAENPIGLSCSTILTVIDNTPPDAQCQNITISLDDMGHTSITTNDIDNESTDACGVASYTLSEMDFNCAHVGDKDVTLTVEDIHGNTSNCTATVTIEDNTLPEASCVSSFDVNLSSSGFHYLYVSDFDQSSNDACGINSRSISVDGLNCGDIGNKTITLTVVDNNGNTSTCTTTVNVKDVDAPFAECQDRTIILTAGSASINTGFINDGSFDACGIADYSLNQTDFNCAHVGENLVTLTVVDNYGNTSTCTATVTVEDHTPPNALCKDNWIWLDYDGTISIGAGHMNDGSNDACGIASLSLSQTEFTCADVGDKLVTLTVEDMNGNTAQCTSTLSVYDTDSPFWLCKNPTIALDATGYASITTDDIDDGSTDACGIASMTLNRTDFSCDDIGENSVTMTLVDLHGNSSSCHATVTIIEGTNLPDAWQSTDIGNVTVGNLYEFSPCTIPNEFSIIGSGNNTMGTTTDNVAFTHQTLCGDGTITAKIESIEPNGYGGLMIRETADDNAKQVALFSNQTNILRHEVRYNPNTPKQIGNFFKPNPIWLRLERQGNWIFSYSSFDGTNFQYVHSVFLSMQSCIEVGLASFTYLPNAQTEAIFSNVSIIGSNGGFAESDEDNVIPEHRPNGDPSTLPNTGPSGNLFPNPNKGHFSIQLDEPIKEQSTIYIYNQYGQQVHQQQLQDNTSQLDFHLERLPSGNYWIKLGDGQLFTTEQFMINR